jgi:hypothetical protein
MDHLHREGLAEGGLLGAVHAAHAAGAPTASRMMYPAPSLRPMSGSPDPLRSAPMGKPQEAQYFASSAQRVAHC